MNNIKLLQTCLKSYCKITGNSCKVPDENVGKTSKLIIYVQLLQNRSGKLLENNWKFLLITWWKHGEHYEIDNVKQQLIYWKVKVKQL